MKYSITILVAFLLLISFTAVSFAGSPVHFAVGAKYWLASWNETYTDPFTGDKETLDPATGSMLGLSASVKKDKFGANITFFSGSGWEWTEELGDFAAYDELGYYYEYYGNLSDKLEYSRSDFILTLSYSFTPRVSLFAGYKSVAYTAKISGEYDYVVDVYDEFGVYQYSQAIAESYSEEGDISGGGPGGGIGVNFPITPGKLIAYANLGYFNLGGDLETGDTIVDLGLNYVVGTNWVVSGGYRYEAYEEDININGVNIGISYFK